MTNLHKRWLLQAAAWTAVAAATAALAGCGKKEEAPAPAPAPVAIIIAKNVYTEVHHPGQEPLR